MPYGWAGTTLEVDLTSGEIKKRETDLQLAEAYLGGKALNAKVLWDRVPPEVDPFSPDNLMIIGGGLLTGTIVPGAAHTCFTFKSPISGLHCYSAMGGFFAAELRHAGYDQVIITGKSPKPVYLFIKDDAVELRDASHLWGKSPHEAQSIMFKQSRLSRLQSVCIGPAGENKVFQATIEHSTGASASRGGGGAIFGDKKLKAVAVYGSKDIAIADASRVVDMSEFLLKRMEQNRRQIVERSGLTYVRTLLRIGDWGYFSGVISPELNQEIKEMADKARQHIEKNRNREVACSNCAMRCKHEYVRPGGTYSFMKCQDWFAPMVATYLLDCDFALSYMELCEKLGLDISGTANMVAFAIAMYQKGILPKEMTDGLTLEWKNADTALKLVEKIGKREGIGDILAEGTYRAARKIGNGAEEYSFAAKKLDLPMYKEYHNQHFAIMSSINEKGDPPMLDDGVGLLLGMPLEVRQGIIKDGWFPYPKDYEKAFLAGLDATGSPVDVEGNVKFSAYDMEAYTLADSAGVCRYWMQYWMYPPLATRKQLAEIIAAATGMDIDGEKATQIALRSINLIKAYNVREGLRKKDDFESIPKHVFTRKPHGNEVPLDPKLFDGMLSFYYKQRGWNPEGIPTAATLESLGLSDVAEDLAKRKII